MEKMQSYLSLTPWEQRSYSVPPEALTRIFSHAQSPWRASLQCCQQEYSRGNRLVKGLSPQRS